MPIYQIERISRDTGMAKKELESAPFLAIAFLQQEMKHGKDYIYKLAGRLENGNIVSTDNKDDHTQPFTTRHTDATSSLALHDQAYQRYRLINRHPGKGGII